jgi:hypothetical protein
VQGKWDLAPVHSGTVNREFSEITPGDSVYCYQASGMPGRILIQLTTTTTLSIEHQSGTCTGKVAFINSVAYQR